MDRKEVSGEGWIGKKSVLKGWMGKSWVGKDWAGEG